METSNRIEIGEDWHSKEPVKIGDIQRRSGLYILGRSGMGKTNLLLHLMENDIQNNHGLFFLDPHGDAVDELISRFCSCENTRDKLSVTCSREIQLLNPINPLYAFGINLLACKDIKSPDERRNTYNRAYSVFYKLWEKEWGERPWLRLIVSYTLRAFLENPGTTLADVPMFLNPDNPEFRKYIAQNVRENKQVADFWLEEFTQRRDIDQQRQVDAARTRMQELLGDPDVRDIVGQQKTTVDFRQILRENRIVLVKFSPELAPDSARFIGTILISELLHAVENRNRLPKSQRRQFGIFIDEFQTFASSQDFKTLFTEARKYGIATTIAHQERFGQFADNKAIAGATDAAANKILFQLSNQDAKEFAPEFAPEPPKKIEWERQLAISSMPFEDLLRISHKNPTIQAFVETYLARYKYMDAWLSHAVQKEKVLRQYYIDQSGQMRLYVKMAENQARRDRDLSDVYLKAADNAINMANDHTKEVLDHFKRQEDLTFLKWHLNQFFSDIMRGKVKPGQDEFIDRLEFWLFTVTISTGSRFPDELKEMLLFYIQLLYGDPTTHRAIPFSLAYLHNLFTDEVSLIVSEIEDKTKSERDAFSREWTLERISRAEDSLKFELSRGKKEIEEKRQQLLLPFKEERRKWNIDTRPAFSRPAFHSEEIWKPQRVYTNYIFLLMYPDIWKVLAPYARDPFTRGYEEIVYSSFSRVCIMPIEQFFREFLQSLKPARKPGWPDGPGWMGGYEGYLRKEVVDSLERFMMRNKGGAFLTLMLLDVARHGPWEEHWPTISKSGYYPNRSMLNFPSVPAEDPIKLLRFVINLNNLLRNQYKGFESDLGEFLRYFYFQSESYITTWGALVEIFRTLTDPSYRRMIPPDQHESYREELEERGFLLKYAAHFGGKFYINLDDVSEHKRTEIRLLRLALDEQAIWFASHFPQASCQWNRFDEMERSYHFARACDLYAYGKDVADKTFPQPISCGPEDVGMALFHLMKERDRQMEEKLKEELYRIFLSNRKDLEEGMAAIQPQPPAALPARLLSGELLEEVKKACLKEFTNWTRYWCSIEAKLEFLEKIKEFCDLLAQPENHIKVLSNQYVEREVPARPVRDMSDETAREMMWLPEFVAYAKIIEERGGQKTIKACKIRTPKPPAQPDWVPVLERDLGAITTGLESLPQSERYTTAQMGEKRVKGFLMTAEMNWLQFLSQSIEMKTIIKGFAKEREQVEKEIQARQKKWKKLASQDSPSAEEKSKGRKPSTRTPRKKPPPTNF